MDVYHSVWHPLLKLDSTIAIITFMNTVFTRPGLFLALFTGCTGILVVGHRGIMMNEVDAHKMKNASNAETHQLKNKSDDESHQHQWETYARCKPKWW